jgi:hypothetical protein
MHQCTMEDLVAHSGPSPRGSLVQTLILTDVAPGWTECARLLVREQSLLGEAAGTGALSSLSMAHPGEDGMPTALTNRRRIARFPCSDLMPSTPIVRSIETSRRLAKQLRIASRRRTDCEVGARRQPAAPPWRPPCRACMFHTARGVGYFSVEVPIVSTPNWQPVVVRHQGARRLSSGTLRVLVETTSTPCHQKLLGCRWRTGEGGHCFRLIATTDSGRSRPGCGGP